MDNQLIEQFFAEYQPGPQEPAEALDPSPEELTDIEDEIGASLSSLDMVELEPGEREELRGRRIFDAADLMAEAAEGLRACPEIREAVGTAPEVFEQVAEQDLATGGLLQALQVLHQAADNGQLLRVGEAERELATIETQVMAAVKDAAIEAGRRQALENSFAQAMELHRQAKKKATAAAAAAKAAAAAVEKQIAAAHGEEDRAEMVRELISEALAGAGAKKKKSKASQ